MGVQTCKEATRFQGKCYVEGSTGCYGQRWSALAWGVGWDTSTPTICQEAPAGTCPQSGPPYAFASLTSKRGGAMLMDPDTPYAAALLPVQIIPPPPSCDWHVPVSLVLLIPCYPRRMISCQSVPQIFLKLNSTLPSEDIFLNSSLWFFSPSALKCHVDPWLPPVSATSGCLKQLRLCYVDSLD